MHDALADPGSAVEALRRCVLFHGFSDDELVRIVPLLEERTVAAGMTIVREGEPATELFIIRDGMVEVTKRAADAAREQRLTMLEAGETFGEMTLVDRAPRSASVRAVEQTTVAMLRMADLDGATERDVATRARMLGNLGSHLARRLRGTNETTVAALEQQLRLAQMRVSMGTFLTYVVFIMVAYGFALRIVGDLSKNTVDTTVVSIPIILVFALPLYVMMRRSGEPIAIYGLTWHGAGAAAADAVLWTLPLLALTLVIKIVLVHTVTSLAGVPIFRFGGFLDPRATSSAAWLSFTLSVAYICVVPLQEFIARGALQSPLQRFLVGPHATAAAIVIANSLFTASHLHLSTTFALIALLPGLLWGWLYTRHGTLIAPIVSHVLVGWVGLFVLGFDQLLT